jgi:hypothetical protein
MWIYTVIFFQLFRINHDGRILEKISYEYDENYVPYSVITTFIFIALDVNKGARGGAVVEALRYKPEGRGFDSRCCH